MTSDTTLFVDIVIAILFAFVGGLVAHFLRLPLIVGYLAAGIIVGPHVIGVIDTTEEVRELAEFGVVLLLFAVGVEISFREIRELGSSIIAIGLSQIVLTVAAGFGLGYGLNWSWEQSLVLGFMISLSSTMVVLKTLMDRGELLSLHGRLLTGVMLIQDLVFVAMIAVVQGMGGEGGVSPQELGMSLLKALAVLAIMLLVGPRLLPTILRRMAAIGQRELFLLSLVAITFTAAALTQEFGLSAAVGAFLAGLALSRSDFGYRALAETVPLKDVFGALFFVSLGMLADPGSITGSPVAVFAIVGTVVGVKLLVLAGVTRVAGYLPYFAILVGIGAGQMGEFSFVLAERGTSLGIFSEELLSVIIMSTVITMAATPAFLAIGTRTLEYLGRSHSTLQPYRSDTASLSDVPSARNGHAIIAGLGRVGSLVATSFVERDIPFVAIDLDPRIVAKWRAEGHEIINGSCGSPEVLAVAGVGKARLLVIATGDERAAYLAAEHSRKNNKTLDIIVRAHWREESERLKTVGVNEVVLPENEAGLEMVRHSLLRFHTRLGEAEQAVETLRDSVTSEGSAFD
jgi:CPA2 family monovalent cation:H+ antiporter-2